MIPPPSSLHLVPLSSTWVPQLQVWTLATSLANERMLFIWPLWLVQSWTPDPSWTNQRITSYPRRWNSQGKLSYFGTESCCFHCELRWSSDGEKLRACEVKISWWRLGVPESTRVEGRSTLDFHPPSPPHPLAYLSLIHLWFWARVLRQGVKD